MDAKTMREVLRPHYDARDIPDEALEALTVPAVPKLAQQILDRIAAGDALDMNHWHECDTTHCVAGWAVHLAGKAGYALEDWFDARAQGAEGDAGGAGAAAAGALIWHESTDGVPDFYAETADAFHDLVRRAGIVNP